MQALANSLAFWLFAFLAIVVVYLLPTLDRADPQS